MIYEHTAMIAAMIVMASMGFMKNKRQ